MNLLHTQTRYDSRNSHVRFPNPQTERHYHLARSTGRRSILWLILS
jgi:hypothetical protein